MRLRNPLSRMNGGAVCRIGVRTRLARAAGADGRYKLAAVRALPTPKHDTVVLQATDGKQAVCVLGPGSLDGPRLVPASVLPTRKDNPGTMIELVGGHWRGGDGKTVPDEYAGDEAYPSIADVLPAFGPKDKTPPIQLGIDLTLLGKVADALGTAKLTLFIPQHDKTPPGNGADGGFVKKPVAVCPATDEGKVRGVGVIMPLTPVNGVPFYAKIRRLVAAAEARCKPRPVIQPTPRNPKRPAQTA